MTPTFTTDPLTARLVSIRIERRRIDERREMRRQRIIDRAKRIRRGRWRRRFEKFLPHHRRVHVARIGTETIESNLPT